MIVQSHLTKAQRPTVYHHVFALKLVDIALTSITSH